MGSVGRATWLWRPSRTVLEWAGLQPRPFVHSEWRVRTLGKSAFQSASLEGDHGSLVALAVGVVVVRSSDTDRQWPGGADLCATSLRDSVTTCLVTVRAAGAVVRRRTYRSLKRRLNRTLVTSEQTVALAGAA
jgi:hypothetical protein